MPNWKKVVVSGSAANLHSLNVSTDVTASNISSSGNIFGNLSENSSTSFKTVVVDPSTGQFYKTGSYGGGGGAGGSAFPFIGDAQITGSLLLSGSQNIKDGNLTISGSSNYSILITGSSTQNTSNGSEIAILDTTRHTGNSYSYGPKITLKANPNDSTYGTTTTINAISTVSGGIGLGPRTVINSNRELVYNNTTTGYNGVGLRIRNNTSPANRNTEHIFAMQNQSGGYAHIARSQMGTGRIFLHGLGTSGVYGMMLKANQNQYLIIGPQTSGTDGAEVVKITSTGFKTTGFIEAVGNITASGNISSSGALISSELTASGLRYPSTDGTDGQVLITDGSGVLTFNDNITYVTVNNNESGTLTKGTPVHAIGTSGNTPLVVAASASVSTKMPATFVLAEDLASGAEGRAVLSGFLNGVNTNGFTEGDVLYVAPDGGYSPNKPSGSNLIQNIALVGKADTNGSIYVYGSGRSNDVPNLLDNQIFFGSGSNQTQQIHISGALDSTIINNITASGNISASGNITSAGLTLPTFTTNRVPFIGSNGELTTDLGFEYNSTTDQLKVHSLDVVHLTSSFITSSTIETSGSNIFGDEAGVDTQTLIGTTKMTGSAQITGSTSILGDTQITGSLLISGSKIHLRGESASPGPILELESINGGSGKDVYVKVGDSNENYAYVFGADDTGNTFRISKGSYSGATLGADDKFIIDGNNIEFPAGNISGSITSTASFGTYIGDGSQLTGISAGTDFTQSLFVSPSGDNSTAVVGDMSKPFATILGATGSANPGDTIIVYPGKYIENNNLYKDGVNYHFIDGAIVESTSPVEPMWGGGGGAANSIEYFSSPVSITGHGEFINTSNTARTGTIFYLGAPSGIIEFKKAFRAGLGGTSYVTAANFAQQQTSDAHGVLTIKGEVENSGSGASLGQVVGFLNGNINAELIVRQHKSAGTAVKIWGSNCDLNATMDVYSEGMAVEVAQRTSALTVLKGRYETLTSNQGTYYCIDAGYNSRGSTLIDAEVRGAIKIEHGSQYEGSTTIMGYQEVSNSPGGAACVIIDGQNQLSQRIYSGQPAFKVTGGYTTFDGTVRNSGYNSKVFDISGGTFNWKGTIPFGVTNYPTTRTDPNVVSGGELVIESQFECWSQPSQVTNEYMFNLSGGTLDIRNKLRNRVDSSNNGIIKYDRWLLKNEWCRTSSCYSNRIFCLCYRVK